MTVPTRTLVLAAGAVGSLGVLGAVLVLQGTGPAASGPAAGGEGVAATGSAAPVGAPAGAGEDGLAERYAVVLEAAPFAVSDFRPRPTPRRVERDPSPRETPREREPDPPDRLELRFTGVCGQGAGWAAVLEARGTGKGLVVASGDALGEVSVASVTTGALGLTGPDGERTIDLGDEVTLDLQLTGRLAELMPAVEDPEGDRPQRSRAARRPARRQPDVELDADQRQAILERLRRRRQRSLEGEDDSGESGGEEDR